MGESLEHVDEASPGWRELRQPGCLVLAAAFVVGVVADVSFGKLIRLPRPPYMPGWVSDDNLLFGSVFLECVALGGLAFATWRRARRPAHLVGLACLAVVLLGTQFLVADRFFSLGGSRARSMNWFSGEYLVYESHTGYLDWPLVRVTVLAVAPVTMSDSPDLRSVRINGKTFGGECVVLVQVDGSVTETTTRLPASVTDERGLDLRLVGRPSAAEGSHVATKKAIGGDHPSDDLRELLRKSIDPSQWDEPMRRFLEEKPDSQKELGAPR